MKPIHSKSVLAAAILAATLSPAQAAPPAKAGNAPTANPTQQGWYLRLTVASADGRMKDSGNVLGQLADSEDGPDSHDLAELSPAFSPYLTLVFPHPEWGMESSYFASDFHAIDFARPDEWEFQVRSSNPNLDVTLSWSEVTAADPAAEEQQGKGRDHLADMSQRMWLEDLDSGEFIAAIDGEGALQNYAFNMDGQRTRNFRWALQGGNGRAPAQARRPNPRAWEELPAASRAELPSAPKFQY